MKMKTTKKVWLAALVLSLCVFYGCKKEEPVATPPPAASAEDVNAAGIQKVCPVMGGETNPAIYAEYKGKKVYFCCQGCKPEFEKNPEKYIGKLPQFTE
jgi:YHS domain-containing protein